MINRPTRGDQSLTLDSQFLCWLVLGAVVLGAGIAGNVSVLLIIKKTQALHTAQNYLLANLAAADITSLLFWCFPLILFMTLLPDGVVGTLLCVFFVSYNVPLTSIVASVFTLAILSVERYNAVVRPMQMLQLTRETVRYAITATWIVSFALNAPLFVHTKYRLKTADCRQLYSNQGELAHIAVYVIFGFIVPFSVIIFCYSKLVKALYFRSAVMPESNIPEKELIRQRRQLLKISITVTLVFGACVFPACVTVVLCHFRLVGTSVRAFGLLLLFISSAVNPFIYAFHSSNYRHSFKRLIKCNL